MTPSVGRIVHYVPDFSFEGECTAAIITAIEADGTISVAAFHPTTVAFERKVPQDRWHWPERVE